ncbi:Major antigen [Toxocara canis]|uniref:Major antigen n=1 Tax=Toxocara canis TaxID=6265 RepID=A0A0B2VVK8_TOXCA|nr:Major antigen [Toxocara canis]
MFIHVVFNSNDDFLTILRRLQRKSECADTVKLEQVKEIALDADSAVSTTEASEVSESITRTIITSTNDSATSGGDTSLLVGDVFSGGDIDFYDASDTFSTNILMSSGSYSVAQLDRAQDDLNSFKRRIDANTEEQREHADLMAGLQRKVEEYRRRVAEIESQIGTRKIDEKLVFSVTEASNESWAPVDVKSLGTDYEMAGRLEEEHRKVEEMRMQLEQARMQIVQMQGENQRLRQQFDVILREKERSYQLREKHLAQYLSEEQRKMMDLWAELQQVRRQCSDYKDQTERDLENQKNELLKVVRSVGGVARQLNLSAEGGGFQSLLSETSSESGVVINQDTVLAEAIRRFREQQSASSKGDVELQNELMKKYEEAIERIIELESRGDGSSTKVTAVEAELKRTKEKLSECQEVLRKLHDLAREAGRNPDITKRTRSLSPTAIHVVPSEVLRSMRYAIRTRDNELLQMKRKLKTTETEIVEMTTRFENAEDARRRLEKQLADSKKELNVQIKAVEIANREIKRLEDRLRAIEVEKAVADGARKHVEEEMRNLKLTFEQSVADGEKKALEDAEERNQIIEEEHKRRISELMRRIEGLVDDNKNLKGNLSDVKDKYRSLETEYNSTLRKIDEKDQVIKNLEGMKNVLLKDLENQRDRFDAVTNELDNLQTDYSTTTKNTIAIEMTVKEIKRQRDEISAQKDELTRELADVRHKMEIEIKKREDIEKDGQRHLSNIEQLRAQVTEYESQLMILRRHNDDLDTQVKTSQAKISTVENSLVSAQKEITKLNELNIKLQKEKQEIMSVKKQMDGELDALKEKLRKMEIEVERLRNENKSLSENEEKANMAYKEEANRVRLLQNEFEEAKVEIEQLERRLKQIDEENKDKLELILNTKKAPSEKSEIYESTQITEIRMKELGDKYKLDMERLENERDELRRRVQLLEDEHTEKERTVEQSMREIDVLKEQYQMEIDRLKAELANLTTKYENDLDDEKDQHNHNMELAKAAEDELRGKLATMEKKLEEALERERTLQEELNNWEEKHNILEREHEKTCEELETIRTDSQTEIQKWKNEANTAHAEIKNLEATIESLKAQLAGATERANTLNKTISEQAAKIRECKLNVLNMELAKAAEDELRGKLATMEKKLEEALERERTLQEELNNWEEKHNILEREHEKTCEELETIRTDSQTEIQKWKNEANTAHAEIKNLEATIESLKAQLAGATERANTLNKTISEQAAKIRELSAQVRRLEDELEDAKATIAAQETDLDSALSRLRSVEEQYGLLQLENTKLIAEDDSLNRQLDTLKCRNASYESELERLKKKLAQLSTTTKEQTAELESLRNERDQLDKASREKSRQVEQLKELIQSLEAKNNRMRQELKETADKLIAAETDRNSLRSELMKLQQELQFGKDQMIRKSDEFHAALEDLANAHRASEDGRVNALQELEATKFEISDLQSRLENSEQRLLTLQQEYINADKERDMLNDSLRRFYAALTRTMSTIPEGAQMVVNAIDVQTVDVHVQKLISRVEKLERERNEYRDSLSRLKRKTSDSHIAINKQETLYKTIEERVADVEEERRAAEAKLASAKQLLRSQEEALKLRDEERRQMKSKIVAFELETRGKDAQLRHLNELVKTLRADLETTQSDLRTLRDREEQWDTNRFQLESKMRDHDGEAQRVNMMIASFETERQSLNESLKKLASQLQASESKSADLKEDSDKLKRDLSKAERIEAELRRSLEEQTERAYGAQSTKEQLIAAQSELANANSRKQQLENELSNTRSELRDHKQHLRDAINRLSDLQRQLQDSHSEKNRLSDKIFALEKAISSQRNAENDLRQQLSTCGNERKTLQSELDDLRRRIEQFESAKRSTNEKIEELSKIRMTLLKKIEILEKEKRSAESVISETALQREAIERSLSALERENKELYRNCAQLQQQIAQLEMDNGNRLIALTNKQKEEHERFVQSVRMEKAQVEKIIENRDRTQKNRIRQLENQLCIMREQLKNERLRRRDATDRIMVSDMSKLGGSVFGLGNSGIASAGATYPLTQGFDYGFSNHSAYSSHYSSPPSFKFPPVVSPSDGVAEMRYRSGYSSYGIGEPLETVHETYTSSYHMTTGLSNEVNGVNGVNGVSEEEVVVDSGDSTEVKKKTTIVVHMKGTPSSTESDSSN